VEKIPADRVTCKYTAKSLNLLVHDVQGKDYELTVQGLLYAIDPADSLFKIKKDTVLLMLKKQKESQSWASVTEQEQKTKDKKALDKPAKAGADDPNGGLMSLMKQMYDEGDDDMKRNIKKAWCESQDKKSGAGGGVPGMESMMDNFQM